MSRSLKKGPFCDDHLMKKVEALNAAKKKEVKMCIRDRWKGSVPGQPHGTAHLGSEGRVHLQRKAG